MTCQHPEVCGLGPGEWCDQCHDTRWDCICLDDDLNSYCPLHGVFDDNGVPQPWCLPDVDGYPPDPKEVSVFDLGDGGILTYDPSRVIFYEAYTIIVAGSWVTPDHEWSTVVPSEEPTEWIALEGCGRGDMVAIIHVPRYNHTKPDQDEQEP